MKVSPVHILLSEEAEKLIDENGVDLVRELQRSGLDVQRAPSATRDEGAKDASLLILTSGVALTVLSFGIAKVLDALGRNKKPVVRQVRYAPLRDASGGVIYDKKGDVVYEWVEESKLLEPSQSRSDQSSLKLSLSATGLKVEMTADSAGD